MRVGIVKEVHDEPLTIQAELLLMYAQRVQLVENRIASLKMVRMGRLVIGTIYSSQAYQGGGRGIDASSSH